MLWGKPMLQHVWERARAARGLDELVIATDDERIAAAARGFGAAVEMTSAGCASGTDRVAEVARRRPRADIVLNLQGDEPELETGAVSRLVEAMRADPALRMGTIAHHEPDAALLARPEVVKVVVDAAGFALYFSRADLADGLARRPGACATRASTPSAATCCSSSPSWPPGALERAERLEQLRALERGVRIRVVLGERPFAGVDTPEQLRGAGETRAAPVRRSPGKGRHGDAQVRLRHRRRRLLARQGDRRRVARAAAQGARPARHAAEVRSLPQRRSRAR